jgi:hypothetical protein
MTSVLVEDDRLESGSQTRARKKEKLMRLNKILSILPIATVILVASIPAQAQGGFGFGFSKFGKHSAVSVGFTTGLRPIHRGVVVVDPIPARCFVPGHYETVCSEVWVPGCSRRVYVDPVYDTCVDPCGNVTRVLIREGGFKVIQDRGHFETRCSQVWVSGGYR